MRGAFYNLVNFINTTSINDVYANAARKYLCDSGKYNN